MKISRNWWIAIVVILVLVVGFGVKKHMDNETIKHNVIVNEQKIAKKLISEYDGIKKIKFTRVSLNSETGSSQYQFTVNDTLKAAFNNYGQGIDDGKLAGSMNMYEGSVLADGKERPHKLKESDMGLNKYDVFYYTVVD
ncbi:hypothetical protein [Weissella oryzae]|uniref:hypothetical protein n=1 Tax=Weissella oryzae TaxID=1129792 RepID=UPI0011AAEA3D|nr:hypothetical protein [Weissella oryzae]